MMQLNLLHSTVRHPFCIKQLRKHSQEQKGWVIIFSDQKIAKADMQSLQVNPKLIWQLNSSLLTDSTLQRLNTQISCVIVTSSLAQHPLIDHLQRTCQGHNIDFMLEVIPKKEVVEKYQDKPTRKHETSGRNKQLYALKKELTELANTLHSQLQMQ